MTSLVPGKKDNKPISSVEDLPATRVLRKRELVNTLNHDNEILNLELTRESREVRKAGSSSAAAEIARYVLIAEQDMVRPSPL